jgi:LemA protein
MNSLKWLIPVGLIGIFIFSMYGWVVGFNNRAVTLKEDSKTSWGNVESSYQRRMT